MRMYGEFPIVVETEEVDLKCNILSGVSMVTLKEVRFAPRARASRFILKRAIGAGAQMCSKENCAY